MARTDALSIYTDSNTRDKLAEIQGFVIETVQKSAVSEKMKNTEYSGDPTAGSVEIDRFKNAQVDDYGTARAAGAGNKILNTGKVTINIDEDKEIVEEIAKKDVKLYGIASIMDKRKKNQALRMIADLDTRFFAQMVTDGTEITGLTTATPLVENLEKIIQSIETTQNDWVDGVDRELIEISVKPSIYGKLLNYIDSVPNPISGLKEDVFHGVKIYSNHRQTKDIICAIHGAVGQPVTIDEYEPEKLQLSNNYDCSLFYSRGTKAVMPDLIRYADIAEPTTETEPETQPETPETPNTNGNEGGNNNG
ncbi:hypothetical protein IJI69_02965 [Candidatus Saccharibacteria bacterium]|nr:hypothetical protein [Candidatus Saccharibacteria bacterium]